MDNDNRAIDSLTEILRIYGQKHFKIKHNFDFEDPSDFFEAWATHLLMGTEHPLIIDKKGDFINKRDWNGVVKAFENYRVSEKSWVENAVDGQRDVLWLFIKQLRKIVDKGKESDRLITKQFEQLLKVSKDGDVEKFKKVVENSITMIVSELSQREIHNKEIMENMNEKVEILQGKLETTKKKAEIDPLTQVFTRGTFDSRLQEMVRASNDLGNDACLFFIDVDNFKNVNDSYGHQVGDEVLKKIADTCISIFKRKNDIVARYGGDEFAIIMPDSTISDGKVAGEKLVEAISKLKFSIEKLQSTVSVGVSQIVENDTAASWLKRSDSAVYDAKESGRNNLKVQDVVKQV